MFQQLCAVDSVDGIRIPTIQGVLDFLHWISTLVLTQTCFIVPALFPYVLSSVQHHTRAERHQTKISHAVFLKPYRVLPVTVAAHFNNTLNPVSEAKAPIPAVRK